MGGLSLHEFRTPTQAFTTEPSLADSILDILVACMLY